MLELVVAELPRQKALGLIAKLRDPFIDQRPVDYVISVHIEGY
jgi:hypothetical protein